MMKGVMTLQVLFLCYQITTNNTVNRILASVPNKRNNCSECYLSHIFFCMMNSVINII